MCGNLKLSWFIWIAKLWLSPLNYMHTRNIARLWWTRKDKKGFNSLLSLNRIVINGITSIFTGHCSSGRLANDFCMNYGSEEEADIVFNLMCQCHAVVIKRWRFLTSHFLTSLIRQGLYVLPSANLPRSV